MSFNLSLFSFLIMNPLGISFKCDLTIKKSFVDLIVFVMFWIKTFLFFNFNIVLFLFLETGISNSNLLESKIISFHLLSSYSHFFSFLLSEDISSSGISFFHVSFLNI